MLLPSDAAHDAHDDGPLVVLFDSDGCVGAGATVVESPAWILALRISSLAALTLNGRTGSVVDDDDDEPLAWPFKVDPDDDDAVAVACDDAVEEDEALRLHRSAMSLIL